MQYYPTQEQAEMLAEGYQTIPVTCELLADTQTPFICICP